MQHRNFFFENRDSRHVRLAIIAPPAGALIDQVVYLEVLGKYLGEAPVGALKDPELRVALTQTIKHAHSLRRRTESMQLKDRLKSARATLSTLIG